MYTNLDYRLNIFPLHSWIQSSEMKNLWLQKRVKTDLKPENDNHLYLLFLFLFFWTLYFFSISLACFGTKPESKWFTICENIFNCAIKFIPIFLCMLDKYDCNTLTWTLASVRRVFWASSSLLVTSGYWVQRKTLSSSSSCWQLKVVLKISKTFFVEKVF